MSEQDFFERNGLEVRQEKVEVGKTYPVFGAVTAILEQGENELQIEVNHHMKLRVIWEETESLEILKGRAFEPGIFNVTFTKIHDPESNQDVKHTHEGNCSTIVFGKRQVAEV